MPTILSPSPVPPSIDNEPLRRRLTGTCLIPSVEESILTGDLILTEVLQGFEGDKDFHAARKLLEPLPFARMVGKDIALRSAENYRLLRRRGVTVRKTIDVLIATFCVMNGHVLLHRDRDFRPMEGWLGLQVL